MKNKIILMRGDIFNYEDGEITEGPGETLDINELP